MAISDERFLRKFNRLMEKQTGKSVRPYRSDGYVNVLNSYGTKRDAQEHYQYQQEPTVPDELLTSYYESDGLFAKIIDAPAEEAIKHGFTLELANQEIEDFYKDALDELDWTEKIMIALKWTRLFGGCLVVMIIDDGRGLDEPLDWKNIRSIDDIRVYERAVVQEDTTGMFSYRPDDPYRTRGSRIGQPEYYNVFSKYGTFRVHESRCLVFQNGTLPENSTNSTYQFWGIPEYIRLHRAIRDAEVAHGTAPKLLDRSVQAIYKMKDLADVLATEDGESQVLKRLETIDMARGMLNSITIDADGEDYDFRTFSYSGVSDVIDSTCNYLSALTNIPQTILFGRSPAGMNSTGESDLENWYSYIERIQNRMLKKNLRYLLSIIFQAGLANGEIDEIPVINIEFNPLWTMSDSEKAAVDQQIASTEQTRAQTAQIYMDAQVIDPTEVRRKLAESSEFDIETMLDDYEDEEDLFAYVPDDDLQAEGAMEDMPEMNVEGDIDLSKEGEVPTAASDSNQSNQSNHTPDRIWLESGKTKEAEYDSLRQKNDVSNISTDNKSKGGSAAVIVVKDGNILTGIRKSEFAGGLLCGAGGHVEEGETLKQTAARECKEEFGITPKGMIQLGYGAWEPDTGLKPAIFLCTDYEGDIVDESSEMEEIKFRSLSEINEMSKLTFQPFKDSLEMMVSAVTGKQAKKIKKTIDKTPADVTIKADEGSSVQQLIFELLHEDDEEEHWISTKTGSHILLNESNEVISGASGSLNGKTLENAESEGKNTSENSTAAREELEQRIEDGRIKTSINHKKQDEHIEGTKEYEERVAKCEANKEPMPSILRLNEREQRELIDKAIKEGEPLLWRDGSIRIQYDNKTNVGKCVYLDGEEKNTSKVQIHMGKKGAHIVPDDPGK